MRLLLVWLQHILIALPAIGTLYVTNISSTASYIGYILFTFLILRGTELVPRSAYVLIPAQFIGFGWLYATYGGLLYFLLFSALISAFLYFRKPIEIGVMTVLFSIVLNIVIVHQSLVTAWVANLIGLSLLLLLVGGLRLSSEHAAMVRSLDILAYNHEQLEQERIRTLEFARKVEDYAQVEERGRIANEIHDDLGHRLIRVKMMTEAVLQLMEHDTKQAAVMLEQVRGQLEESMNNMRYTVRKLRPPEAKNVRRYALHRLIEDAGRDLQITVSFEVSGKPTPLYPSVEYVLYRNAQEAITNAVRHGGASAVQIDLDFAVDNVTMSITNNGKVPKDDITHGLGLKGMQERLAMLGGKLAVALEPTFVISTIVPYFEARSRTLEGE